MRRAIVLGSCLALLLVAGLAWWWPPAKTLAVGAEHPLFGFIAHREAQAAGSARAVRTLLAQVAPHGARPGLRVALSREDATESHFGFGYAEPGFVVAPGDAPRPPHPAVLPREALRLLAATPGGYLVARTERPADLVATGRRRAWFGGEVAIIANQARAVTVAVGEGGFPRQVIAVFAFEYASGEQAEAALRTLTTGKPGGEAGFTLPPGALEAARSRAIVALHYEVAAALVEQAAAGR
jgi:hypothetical protein